MNEKIGILFGAGAEVCLGMPSGGEFALSIFFPEEKIIEKAKKNFENYYGKGGKFKEFGVQDYNTIVRSIVENNHGKFPKLNDEKKKKIIDYVEKIDAFNASDKSVKENKVYNKENFTSLVQIYAAFHLIKEAYSEKDRVSGAVIFDDKIKKLFGESVEGLFSVNYKNILILKKEVFSIIRKNANDRQKEAAGEISEDLKKVFDEVAEEIKEIFLKIFDYQLLLNEYYGYLFKDKKSENLDDGFKTKHYKIVSFLFIIQQYLEEKFSRKAPYENSYYSDIKDSGADKFVIASTNYSKIEGLDINFLNGLTNKYLDLKSYDIVDGEQARKNKEQSEEKYFYVPFIFPQTTIKPFVSMDEVMPFAETYKGFFECSKIAVIGFGFNSDDALLKSMFHKLIEKGKQVIYFCYGKDTSVDSVYASLRDKLHVKLEDGKNLQIRKIDDERNDTETGKNWLDYMNESL